MVCTVTSSPIVSGVSAVTGASPLPPRAPFDHIKMPATTPAAASATSTAPPSSSHLSAPPLPAGACCTIHRPCSPLDCGATHMCGCPQWSQRTTVDSAGGLMGAPQLLHSSS